MCIYATFLQPAWCMYVIMQPTPTHTHNIHRTDRPTEKKEKRKHHIIQTLQILVLCIPSFLTLTHALSISSDLTRKNDNLSWILSHDHLISRSFYIFSLFIISRIRKRLNKCTRVGGWHVSPAVYVVIICWCCCCVQPIIPFRNNRTCSAPVFFSSG